MNAQELFLDVSSGRFLDGESTIPSNKPTFYSNEEKRVKVSIRKVRNNVLSSVTPSADARYRIRIGTDSAKVADLTDIPVTPPILIQALAQVSTAPSTQATGICLLTNYTPVTAIIRADVSQETAVTAVITAGITSVSSFISTTTIAIPEETVENKVFDYFGGRPSTVFPRNNSVKPFGNPRPVILVVTASLNTPIQAQFTTSFFNGSVSTIGITNTGIGYPNGSFNLVFSGGGATAGTVTATANAVASGGIITSVNLTSGGSGYASAPTASLFIPEKQVSSLNVTNKIGNVGQNKQRFYWAYATTSVSTPIVSLNFSTPESTATTIPISVPSAFITAISGNIWELNLVSNGYGYAAIPTVTHDAALVSTSKFSASVTADVNGNILSIIGDFSGQTYIKNGGCALLFDEWEGNTTKYKSFWPPAWSGVWKASGIFTNPAFLRDFLNGPISIAEQKNEPTTLISDVAEKDFVINLKAETDSNGDVKYSAPMIVQGGLSSGNRYFNDGPNLVQEFSASAYGVIQQSISSGGAVQKPALFKISTAPARTDYSVIYASPFNSSVEVSAVLQGGGIYEPTIEIVDYGEGYTSSFRDLSSGTYQLKSLKPQILVETVKPVTAEFAVYPIDTPISYSATIATRPGRFGTQYYISNGGFGYGGGSIVLLSSLPVVTGGIVTTARLLNIPKLYDDGEYSCTVQPPSVGTAANIILVIEDGVGRPVILDGGSGYTSSPIITAPPANLRFGLVESAIVTNNPQGYELNKPYLLETQSSPVTGGNCSLSLINTGDNFVVEIVERGFGYTTSPIVTAPSPDLPQGIINSVQVSTRGQGYRDGVYDCIVQAAPAGGKTPKIVFNKDSLNATFNVLEQGYGYTTAPIISVVTPFGNLVNGITITCGGSFYENNTIYFTLDDSTGIGATFNSPTISGGVVKNISVSNRGYGYSNEPKINFNLPIAPTLPDQDSSEIIGNLIITTASASAVLSTFTQRDILMEVFETDGTNEQVVAQATVSLAKRVLE